MVVAFADRQVYALDSDFAYVLEGKKSRKVSALINDSRFLRARKKI
jgi:hypothetical protein